MIHYAPKNIENFIEFLNSNYPTTKNVYVSVMHGYDCLDCGDDRVFAAYSHYGDVPVIITAGSKPKGLEDEPWVLEHHIAHEYCHHRQWCDSRDFDEEEAEKFAATAVATWAIRCEISDFQSIVSE